jgi:hypothetical protein
MGLMIAAKIGLFVVVRLAENIARSETIRFLDYCDLVSLIGPLPSSPLILLPEMVNTSSIHPSLIQSMNNLPFIKRPIPSDASS